jgi:cyclophilin family peptidyl-prolyl cis-trans isomerase
MRLFDLLAAAAFSALAAFSQDPGTLEAVVTTDAGSFRFEFAPDKAPNHVAQFIERARAGYYDGSAFHRVVANGIIQGGDPLLRNPKTPRALWGTGGLNLLPNEISDLKHERGVVSTVRIPGKANSDGSQFFVCVFPQPTLDGQFSAFGKVTEGMDVVERISRVPVGPDGLTGQPVRILKIAIEKKKTAPFSGANVEELRKIVTLKTTLGAIKIKLEPDWAPEHVRNFLMLTSTGWYNGTAFHRIIRGFVVQGGMGGPENRWIHPLKHEFREDVKHTRGIVSMARSDDPDSATTSFFLVLGDAPHLDGKYTAFGRVVEGLEVLDAFEKEDLDGETPKRRLELVEASID